MAVQSISAGAGVQANEDLVMAVDTGDVTDLVVIDGGTSVADRDYIDEEHGDVVWFVRGFAAALAGSIAAHRSQEDSLGMALDTLRTEFRHRIAGRRIAGRDMPTYAWPIAALTWIRIAPADAGHRLQLYSLGDCSALARTLTGDVIDLDPFLNPQEAILKAEIARLVGEGISDPEARRARLLPLLRARRESQNLDPAPITLCLHPRGRFAARTRDLTLAHGASVLAMTDGFYRLVDTYRLYTDELLLQRCADSGPVQLLAELRAHEQGLADADSLAVKRADDASAIFWRAD
jgi:hypothetical protein